MKRFLLISCITVFFASCSNINSEFNNDSVLHNKNEFSWNEYTLYLDLTENQIYMTSKTDDNPIPLIKAENIINQEIQCIFVSENKLYYLTRDDKGQGFTLYELDLITMKNIIVYTTISAELFDWWGLYKSNEQDINTFMADFDSMFVLNNKVILANSDGIVELINLDTRQKEVLVNDITDGKKIWIYHENMYYINHVYHLTSIHLNTREKNCYEDFNVFNFYIEDKSLIYEDVLGNSDKLILD